MPNLNRAQSGLGGDFDQRMTVPDVGGGPSLAGRFGKQFANQPVLELVEQAPAEYAHSMAACERLEAAAMASKSKKSEATKQDWPVLRLDGDPDENVGAIKTAKRGWHRSALGWRFGS